MSGIYQRKQGLRLILAQHKSPGDCFSFRTTSFRCPVTTVKLKEENILKFLSEKQDFYDVSGLNRKGDFTLYLGRICPYIQTNSPSLQTRRGNVPTSPHRIFQSASVSVASSRHLSLSGRHLSCLFLAQ